jgi:hypothetical protein
MTLNEWKEWFENYKDSEKIEYLPYRIKEIIADWQADQDSRGCMRVKCRHYATTCDCLRNRICYRALYPHGDGYEPKEVTKQKGCGGFFANAMYMNYRCGDMCYGEILLCIDCKSKEPKEVEK